MGLISEFVKVRLSSKNVKRFEERGYEIPKRKKIRNGVELDELVSDFSKYIHVKPCDLPDGSQVKVDVKCEYCNETIFQMQYKRYKDMTDAREKICCYKCKGIKTIESNLKKYGVKGTNALPSVQEKIRNTCIERYGVSSYTKTSECQERKRDTCMEKYGVPVSSQNEEVKEKFRNTCMEKYGVDHPWKIDEVKAKVDATIQKKYGVDNISQLNEIKQRKAQSNLEHTGYAYNLQNPEIFEKSKQTNKETWGTEYPMQSPLFKERMIELYGDSCSMRIEQFKEKAINTLHKNGGDVATSQQQIYINNLYQGKLNHICKYYALDIALLDDMINIEIDFGGHDLCVKLGTMTQEEFDHKEMIRDIVVKKEGYKIMRLVSRKDKLPSDKILLQILEFSKEYFNTTEHTWINWDIDQSMYYNAEHQNGVLFDFGELRTLRRNSQSA